MFRREMLNCKSNLTHEQLVDALEMELLRIHRDEVASDAISSYHMHDNATGNCSAKAATRLTAQPAQSDTE